MKIRDQFRNKHKENGKIIVLNTHTISYIDLQCFVK